MFKTAQTSRPVGHLRRNSYDSTLELEKESDRQAIKLTRFSRWLLKRSHYSYTPQQYEELLRFNRVLRAVITELWYAIKNIANGKIEVARDESLFEKLCQVGLAQIPFIGSHLVDVEKSIMMQRYRAHFARISEKLDLNLTMDAINIAFSARATAYFRAEILSSSKELSVLEKTFQPLMGWVKTIVDKVIDNQGSSVTNAQLELIKLIVAQLLAALEHVPVNHEVDKYEFAANLAYSIGIIETPNPRLLLSPKSGKDDEFSSSHLWQTSFDLLRLSQLSYQYKNLIEQKAQVWDHQVSYSHESDVRGFMLANSQQVVLSFRGTATIDNIGTDLNAAKHSINNNKNEQVHKGVHNALQRIWPKLKQSVTDHLKKNSHQKLMVWCTGHSLGGALATLAALLLLEEDPKLKVVLVTFGQPRVVNRALQLRLQQQLTGVYRWVTEYDPVPSLPTEAMGFYHVGEERRLSEKATTGKALIPFDVSQHSLTYYQRRLLASAKYSGFELQVDQSEVDFDKYWKPEESTRREAQRVDFQKSLYRQRLSTMGPEDVDTDIDQLIQQESVLTKPISAAQNTDIPQSLATKAAKDFKEIISQLVQQFFAGSEMIQLQHTCNTLKQMLVEAKILRFSYTQAAELEKIIISRQFIESSANFKRDLFWCMKHLLLRGFLQSDGLGYQSSTELNDKIRRAVPLKKEAETVLVVEQSTPLMLLYKIVTYQYQTLDVSLVDIGDELSRLFTISGSDLSNEEWEKYLDELHDKLKQHDLLSGNEGLLLLLSILKETQLKQELVIIRWVQKALWSYLNDITLELETAYNELDLAGLCFISTAINQAPLAVAEQLLLGDETAVGLRFWLTRKLSKDITRVDWMSTLFLKIHLMRVLQDYPEKSFVDFLMAFMMPLENHADELAEVLREVVRKEKNPAMRLHYCILYQRLLELENIPLTWRDYIALGDASYPIEHQLARRAYLRAQSLFEKNKAETTSISVQEQLNRMKDRLCSLAISESEELVARGKKIEGVRVLLSAITAGSNYENAALPSTQQQALQALFNTTLEPMQDFLNERLAKISRVLTTKDDQEDILKKGGVIVTGVFSGTRVLNAVSINQLFDGEQIRVANIRQEGNKKIQEGRHRVAIIGQEPYQLHIKENPASPGLALSAWILYQLMYGLTGKAYPGLVPVEVLKIERIYQGKRYTYHVQASPTIYGDNLRDVFALPQDKLNQQLSKLNKAQFNALMIAYILLAPEDGRAPNFIFVKEADGSYSVVGIDNDHVGVSKETQEETITKKVRPVVKTVVYCMPHMLEPIDSHVRKQLSSEAFSPFETMKIWLYCLWYYNHALSKVYTYAHQTALFERTSEDAVVLQAYFNVDELSRLFMKSLFLRRGLTDQNVRTPLDLLLKVQPALGKLYQDALKNTAIKSPQHIFDQLTSGLFTSSGGTKTTNSQLAQLVVGKSVTSYSALVKECSLPHELLKKLRHIYNEGQVIEFIMNDLAQGNLSLFKDMRDLQEMILHKLSFRDMRPGVYTPVFHQQFLAAIANDIKAIVFHYNPLLTDEELVLLIERCENVTAIELVGCPKIQGDTINLRGGVFNLQTRRQKSFIDALAKKKMRSLIIKDCDNLQESIITELLNAYGTNNTVEIILEGNAKLSITLRQTLKKDRNSPASESKAHYDSILKLNKERNAQKAVEKNEGMPVPSLPPGFGFSKDGIIILKSMAIGPRFIKTECVIRFFNDTYSSVLDDLSNGGVSNFYTRGYIKDDQKFKIQFSDMSIHTGVGRSHNMYEAYQKNSVATLAFVDLTHGFDAYESSSGAESDLRAIQSMISKILTPTTLVLIGILTSPPVGSYNQSLPLPSITTEDFSDFVRKKFSFADRVDAFYVCNPKTGEGMEEAFMGWVDLVLQKVDLKEIKQQKFKR